MAIDLSDLGPTGENPSKVDLSDLGPRAEPGGKPIDLSDLGPQDQSLISSIKEGAQAGLTAAVNTPRNVVSALGTKEGFEKNAKAAAAVPLTAIRGYEALGVGGINTITGEGAQPSLARAAEATQPGFKPANLKETAGQMIGGSLPFLVIPAGAAEVGVQLSRAGRLLHAAKVGALFGGSLSTLETLEEKGSVSLDDAEKIAMNAGMTALISTAGEAILGPLLRKVFPGKTSKGPGVEPLPEIPPSTPELPSDYVPSAAARRVRNAPSIDELDNIQTRNQQDLEELIKARDQLKVHEPALSPEAKQNLDEINQEVVRLQKSDKIATTKQMLKEMGQDTAEMTPAKAEDTLTRISKHDFVVALKSDKGLIIGQPGEIHGMLESPGGMVEAGYVDRNTGKFYTKDEANAIVNPNHKPGDVLHSSQLVELQKMSKEELRAEQMRVSTERNKIWNEKYKNLPGTEKEKVARAKADPEYQALDKQDLELHKAMSGSKIEPIIEESKVKDLTPTLNTAKGMIKGTPGQELDDLIAQHDLDLVADNVIEGYTDKAGKFMTKEEVLGPTEPTGGKVPERSRLLNQWATETASAAKDLGYKTPDEALTWAEKNHHYLTNEYKLALRNQFVKLTKENNLISVERFDDPTRTIKSESLFFSPEGEGNADYGPIKQKAKIDKSKIYESRVGVSDFLNSKGLLDKPIPVKYRKWYKGEYENLFQIQESPDEADHEIWWQIYQDMAEKILKKEGYSGASWFEPMNDDRNQFQIWDRNIIQDYDKGSKSIVSATPIEVGESAPILKASEMPVGTPPVETSAQAFQKHEPVPGVEVYSKPVEKQTQELSNPWAEKMADRAKKAGAKDVKEAIAWASKQEKDLLLFDKQNIAYEFDRKYGTGEPINIDEVVPELKDLQAKLSPVAGANPEVADTLDAARKAGVKREPHVTMATQYNATGQGWKFNLKGLDKELVEKGLPNANQLKIKADTATSRVAAETGVPEKIVQASSNLPGTDVAPAFIPEYVAGTSNWRVGWFARLARSTAGVLEKMGSGGKELAARIKLADDASFVKSNSIIYQFDKYVTQIPKKEWHIAGMALSDQLEKRPSNYKLPPGMLEYTQKIFKDFGAEAKINLLEILRADGTKVPWVDRNDFYPRVVKAEYLDGLMRNDPLTVGRVKTYFLESKQVASEYQASQKAQALRMKYMERRYGHLERAREYDLPPEFYDRQAITVVPEYVRSASHRLEEVRQFGMHDVKVIKLLDQIAAEGHDATMARQIFDRYAGTEVSDIVHTRLVQGVKNLVTGMSIQFPSAITQIGQVLTPIHRATTPELGLGLAKAYARGAGAFIKAFTRLGKEEAAHSGMAFESAAVDYLLDTYGGVKPKPFEKFARTSLAIEGFSGEDTFFRRFAAILGKKHIEDELIPRIIRNGSDKYAVTELRALGLNPTIVKAQGGLAEGELNIAVKRFSDQTQGNPNVMNLPLWWSSPNGRLATQFHTFSVVIGKENWLLAKNAVLTGNVNRLVSMGLGTPLVGAGISFIKEEMLGLKPQDFTGDKQTDNIIRWYMNGTSFGVALDLALSLSKGRSAFTNMTQIPAFQTLAGLTADVYAGMKGDKKALKRIAQKTPVVGRVLFQ
jgi:hypothetical protein